MTRTGEPLNIYLSEDRAVIEEIVTGKILGSVSFDEDELYYVILPLLDDPSVEVYAVITKTETIRKRGNRMHVEIELTIPKKFKRHSGSEWKSHKGTTKIVEESIKGGKI